MMGSKTTKEVYIICQPEKMSIPVIMWPSEWKSYDNYQPQLQLIQFDFYHNTQFLFIYATE